MHRVALVSLISLLGFALLGCEDKKATPTGAPTAVPIGAVPATPAVPTTPATPQMNPNDPAQAVAQMQKALGLAGNNPSVKTVSWRDLAPLLADNLGGWKADGEVKGETNSMGGFSVSEARRGYKKDALTAELKIVDTSMNQMLGAAFNMARMANVDASDHYQRGIDVGSAPGVEEWHSGSKNGKVTVLVGGRFIVESNVSNVPDTKPLVELVSKLDLAKLASIK